MLEGSLGQRLGSVSCQLAENCGFDCQFHVMEAVTDSESIRRPPERDRFGNDDEWDEAVFDWQTSVKPWLCVRNGASPSLDEYLTQRLVWTSNSRRYTHSRPKSLLGRFQTLRFNPPQVQQDQNHDQLVVELANSVANIVGHDADVYETDHLLDIDSVDRSEYEWDCFYDETIACVGASTIVLIWLGHSRYYG